METINVNLTRTSEGDISLAFFVRGEPKREATQDLIEKYKESIGSIFEIYPQLKTESEIKAEEEKEKLVDIINKKTTDEEKLELIEIYPTWEDLIGKSAEVDKVFNYQGTLYKVRQPHAFSEEWIPNVEEALYIKVGQKDEETGLEEIVPDNLNPYGKGFKGTYEGHVYESNYHGNANIPYIGSVLPDWWTDLGTIKEYLANLGGTDETNEQ